MNSRSNLQTRVEEKLVKYINKFTRYAGFSHLPLDQREILTGTFLYLVEEHDLVPDDVPNIGYLDDLMVFIAAAASFIEGQRGQAIPGVVTPEDVAEDEEFIKQNEGLLFGVQKPSISTLQKMGAGKSSDLSMLCKSIREKYANLGRMEP